MLYANAGDTVAPVLRVRDWLKTGIYNVDFLGIQILLTSNIEVKKSFFFFFLII